MTILSPRATGRKQNGRFGERVSGNPTGRPKGARNRATHVADALLDGEAIALVRKAVDLAKKGDVIALRLCIERLMPRRTERAIEFELPRISEPKDAVAALSRITDGVAHGELTPGEAASLVSVVEATIKAIEVLELDRRLTALEDSSHAED